MEQKKSKVTNSIYQKQFSSSYGEGHIFEITFENGDKGKYFSKEKDQSTFRIGQESEYTIEQKVNGQYTNTTVKPVRAGFVPGKGNPSYEHKRTALRCAVDLAASGKIELNKVSEYANSFMKFLNTE